LEQLRNKVHATEGTVLKIFNANIPTAQKSLLTGVSGISSIAFNFYPELISYLVQNYDKNDEKTKKVNSFITVADTLLHQKYPFSAKYFLNSRGMKLNVKTRSGSLHFDPQDYLQFAELKFMMERVASETKIKLMDF
jgi:4-hydroxy-tetrahydrodipicolinate synthase